MDNVRPASAPPSRRRVTKKRIYCLTISRRAQVVAPVRGSRAEKILEGRNRRAKHQNYVRSQDPRKGVLGGVAYMHEWGPRGMTRAQKRQQQELQQQQQQQQQQQPRQQGSAGGVRTRQGERRVAAAGGAGRCCGGGGAASSSVQRLYQSRAVYDPEGEAYRQPLARGAFAELGLAPDGRGPLVPPARERRGKGSGWIGDGGGGGGGGGGGAGGRHARPRSAPPRQQQQHQQQQQQQWDARRRLQQKKTQRKGARKAARKKGEVAHLRAVFAEERALCARIREEQWALHPEVPIPNGYWAHRGTPAERADPRLNGYACEGAVRNRVSGFTLRDTAVV